MPTREPSACPHRVLNASDSEETAACALVDRLIKPFAGSLNSTVRIQPDVCHACCDFPVPNAPDLNPVIASQVYSAASACSNESLSVEKQVLKYQVTEFAKRRLIHEHIETECKEIHSTVVAVADAGRKRSWIASETVDSLCGSLNSRSIARLFGKKPRVGLAGWNSKYGLGHMNRDIVRHVDIHSWLAPDSPSSSNDEINRTKCRYAARNATDRELCDWLSDLDVMLFVEQPPFPRLLTLARQQKVPVVCVALWEWLRPDLDWISKVDLMLCPTHHAFRLLGEWKEQFGFAWHRRLIQWPISLDRFSFRLRNECKRFVFVGGGGGCRAIMADSNATIRRKGLAIVLHAAELLRDHEFLVYSEEKIQHRPSNVTIRRFTAKNQELYRDGDVCVQPSYWEGLGLPLLECQASGLPLVTTDAAPMNEHQPIAKIPVRRTTTARLPGGHVIPVPRLDPADVAQVLANVASQSIAEASRHAFEYVSNNHSWSNSLCHIRDSILDCVEAYEHS